jgi:rhodanese-related sulfurtransferase
MAYAGDISPKEAWDILKKDPKAVLIDVRTKPEWTFVGVPNLQELGRKPELIEWQAYPTMQVNPTFAKDVAAIAADKDAPVLFLCRSGARSRAAAEAMTAEGYKKCYNIGTGFEGNHDGEGHRGHVAGWKADGLPWGQN